jgi:hypothetical protein
MKEEELKVLGVELDYVPCFRGLVSTGFGPQTPTGGCGGDFPPTIDAGGSRGGVVNLDRSRCQIYDGRSYFNLRVFCLRRQPSIIYERIILRLCIIQREDNVLLDKIKERTGNFSVDVAQIG